MPLIVLRYDFTMPRIIWFHLYIAVTRVSFKPAIRSKRILRTFLQLSLLQQTGVLNVESSWQSLEKIVYLLWRYILFFCLFLCFFFFFVCVCGVWGWVGGCVRVGVWGGVTCLFIDNMRRNLIYFFFGFGFVIAIYAFLFCFCFCFLFVCLFVCFLP